MNSIRESVLEYASNVSTGQCESWLLLHGATGTGKTHLAEALINHVCMFYVGSGEGGLRYYRLNKLMRAVRDSFKGEGDSEKYMLEKAEGRQLLILDEISEKKIGDWERAFLEDLLDYRYEKRLPTVFATNLDPVAFFEMFGDRIESRFAHIGKMISFDWGDYRKGEK